MAGTKTMTFFTHWCGRRQRKSAESLCESGGNAGPSFVQPAAFFVSERLGLTTMASRAPRRTARSAEELPASPKARTPDLPVRAFNLFALRKFIFPSLART